MAWKGIKSPVLISLLDFGCKVCILKKKVYKMWILPRHFAHEVLLEQVIATDKLIIHCDWILRCGKVKIITAWFSNALVMQAGFNSKSLPA